MATERDTRSPGSGLGAGSLDSGFALLRSRLESSISSDANEDEVARLKAQIHERLLIAEQASVLASMSREQIQPVLNQQADLVLAETGRTLPLRTRMRVLQEILDEVTGYGPIQPLLQDDTISEIMVKGPKKSYVGAEGGLTHTAPRLR